jgi:uncharacterized protein
LSSKQRGDLPYYCDHLLKGILHPIEYVQGLVFAVAAAPEIPMPDKWLLWVFKQHGQITDIQQADKLTDLLMKELQRQLQLMRTNSIELPQHFAFPSSNDAPVSIWLTGLLAGHSLLETVWQDAWDRVEKQAPEQLPSMQKNLRHCLSMFTTFADISFARNQAIQQSNHDLEAQLPTIFLSLTDALQTYVRLSGVLVDFMPDQFETFVKGSKS